MFKSVAVEGKVTRDMNTPLVCEKCGRSGTAQITACPMRSDGTCTYEADQERLSPLFGAMMFGIGSLELGILLVAAIALVIAGGTWGWILSGICGIPMLLMGTALTGLGLILTVGNRDRLKEERSGRVFHQISLAGRTVYEAVTDFPEKLSFALPDSPFLTHPASITAIQLHPPAEYPRSFIYWNRYAVELLLTSLVSLLASGMVVVERSSVHRSFLGGIIHREPVNDYFFLPSERDDDTHAVGALEHRITQVVANWPADPAARTWPHAIPSHRLAIALVGKMRWNPGRWLYCLVREELEEQVIWQCIDYESGDAYSILQAEGAALEEWLRLIAAANPGFIGTLRSDLFRGLSFMEWDYPDIR